MIGWLNGILWVAGAFASFVALCFVWVGVKHGFNWFPARYAAKKLEYQELNERARLKAQRVRWKR